jgi:hypothetical protein
MLPSFAFGQTGKITYKATDAPVTSVLPTIFSQAGVKSYVIDSKVTGNVTFELSDQSLESTLKIICRVNPMLTWSKDGDVYLIEVRKVSSTIQSPAPIQDLPIVDILPKYEKISLTYLDPYDLQAVLGPFTIVRNYSRFNQGYSGMGGMSGMGGNQGGFGNFGGFSSTGNFGSFGGFSSMNNMGNPGGFGRKEVSSGG